MSLPSGKFVLRLPPSLHARLAEQAEKAGLSLNEFCKQALDKTTGAPSENALVEQARRALGGTSPLAIVLFGSQARGEARASSDTDLLLVMDDEIRLSPLLYRSWDERIGSNSLSPHFVHLPPSADDVGSLWLEVSLDGRVLWEQDRRVSQLLGEIRALILSGRYIRKMTHGHPYWSKAER